jgi:hypothetical protein
MHRLVIGFVTDLHVRSRGYLPGPRPPMSSGGPLGSCCSSETGLKCTGSIIGLDMQQIESQGGTK